MKLAYSCTSSLQILNFYIYKPIILFHLKFYIIKSDAILSYIMRSMNISHKTQIYGNI